MSSRRHHFERHRTKDLDLERVQDNIQRFVEQANKRVIVKDVQMLAAGNVVVKHPLGRAPARWWIVRVTDGFPQFYESARSATTITFTSLNICTVDLEME